MPVSTGAIEAAAGRTVAVTPAARARSYGGTSDSVYERLDDEASGERAQREQHREPFDDPERRRAGTRRCGDFHAIFVHDERDERDDGAGGGVEQQHAVIGQHGCGQRAEGERDLFDRGERADVLSARAHHAQQARANDRGLAAGQQRRGDDHRDAARAEGSPGTNARTGRPVSAEVSAPARSARPACTAWRYAGTSAGALLNDA